MNQTEILKKQRRQQLQLQRTIQRQKQQAQLRLSQQRQQQQTQQQQSKEEQEKAKKEQQQLQTQLNSTIDKINQGKITSLSQIPESQLKYLDKTQIQKAIEQRKQVEKGRKAKKQYQQAVKVYTGQTSAGALEGIPKSIRESAKKYVESSPSLSSQSTFSEATALSKAGLGGLSYVEKFEIKPSTIEPLPEGSALSIIPKGSVSDFISTPTQSLFPTSAVDVVKKGNIREYTQPAKPLFNQPRVDVSNINYDFKDVVMSEIDSQAFSPFGTGVPEVSKSTAVIEQPTFDFFGNVYYKQGEKYDVPVSVPASELKFKQPNPLELFGYRERPMTQAEIRKEQLISEPSFEAYKELYGMGDYPSLVRKGFFDIGGGLLFGFGKASEKTLGTRPLTTEEIQTYGGSIAGNLLLSGFFSPAFKIGGTQQEAVSTQLTKNKFDKLKKLLDDLADELKTKSTDPVAQKKILLKFKKDLKLNDRNFKLLVEELEKQNILTTQVYTIGESGVIAETGLQESGIFVQVPKLKQAGKLTSLSTLEKQKAQQDNKIAQILLTGQETQQKQKVNTAQIVGLLSVQQQKQKTQQKQVQKQTTALSTTTAITNILGLKTPTKTTQPRTPTRPIFSEFQEPEKPKKPRFPIIPLKFKSKQQQLLSEAEKKNYDIFIKELGKWKRVNKNPVKSYSRARDIGSYYADNLLSARFRLRPTNRKSNKQEKLNIQQNYFNLNYGKFRPYRKQKGEKVRLNNEFIEKRSFRLDKPSEVSRIKLARFRKQQQDYLKNINRMFGSFKPPKRKVKGGLNSFSKILLG